MDENIEICKVSDWSSWGECTKPCGGGVQYATRFPLHDGYNEYDCGALSKSQTCNSNPCPTSSVAFFKSIDYKNKKFKGWDEVDVPNICKNVEKSLEVSDSMTIYYDAETGIDIGVFIELDNNNELSEYFNLSANGEFILVDDLFLKIKGREVIEIKHCNDFVFNTEAETEQTEWCGSDYTNDSFICLIGTSETEDKLNSKIADRYYYDVSQPSLKTEWVSRNNLLRIQYLSATDRRNTQIKRNIWAIIDLDETILFYNTNFEEDDVCPPKNTIWIPILPRVSNNVRLTSDCEPSTDAEMSCDLKDAYLANWFDYDYDSSFVNHFEKNQIKYENNSDELKNDFEHILKRGAGTPEYENIFSQTSYGKFNINELVTNPKGVGVKKYLANNEVSGSVLHKIDFPLSLPIDLVRLKLMSIMGDIGSFDVQVFSLKKQKWVKLDTVNHFKKNQQIVSDIKNENYDDINPPINGVDVIEESIVAIRVFFGSSDYQTDTNSPIEVTSQLQSLVIYSLRVEGRDEKKCRASEVEYIQSGSIFPITKQSKKEKPKLFKGSTEIVGDLCIGNLVYGNYKYEGHLENLYYTWSVNDILYSNTRHFNTSDLREGDVLKFEVTFVDYDGIRTTFTISDVISNCNAKIYPPLNNKRNF